jgi:hypothetical protein
LFKSYCVQASLFSARDAKMKRGFCPPLEIDILEIERDIHKKKAMPFDDAFVKA